MVLLRHLVRNHKSFAIEELKNHDKWDETFEFIILRILRTTDLHEFESFPVDMMIKRYEKASLKTKIAYLKFFKKIRREIPQLQDAVFRDRWGVQDPELQKEVTDIISHWFMMTQLTKA